MALLTLSSSVLTLVTDVLEPGVSFGKRANWSQSSPMNRSSPVITYGSSDSTTFEFAFQVYGTDGPDAVTEAANSIKSLVYPLEPGVVPPVVCYLTYPAGRFDNWPCVCTGVGVSYPSQVWDRNSGESLHATITVSLIELDFNGRSANEYAGNISNLTARYR